MFKELITIFYLFADTVSSMVTNIFKNAAVLCPILPQYKELPLNVNFLNKSLQCSGKIGIETECNTQGIIIEYKCSAERGNFYE